VPVSVRAVSVPPTVTEFALDALSTPLATPSVSTSDSSALPLPASRSAPVKTKALAVSAVTVTACGKAAIAGEVAVPLLPKATPACAWMVICALWADLTKPPSSVCAVAGPRAAPGASAVAHDGCRRDVPNRADRGAPVCSAPPLERVGRHQRREARTKMSVAR
jgi:hypothetical protein